MEIKRFVGLWEEATAYPIELIMAIHELNLPDGDPEKNDKAIACDITSDTFQLISCGGFCLAAVTDQIICFAALAVFGISFGGTYLFKLIRFLLKLRAKGS